MKLSKTIFYILLVVILVSITTVYLFSQTQKKISWKKKAVKVPVSLALRSKVNWRDILKNKKNPAINEVIKSKIITNEQHKFAEEDKKGHFLRSYGQNALPPNELEELKHEAKTGKFRGFNFPPNINLRDMSLEDLEALRKEILAKEKEGFYHENHKK